MNWRRLAWLMILLLAVTIALAIMDLKDAYEKLESAKSGDTDDANMRLLSLQKEIDSRRVHLADLEQITLWERETDFMSWVTQQANDTDVQVIGVERLPVEQESHYQGIPVTITIRGNYNPLGRFINHLERCPRAIRIDSLRIRRRTNTPEDIVMDLSMSYFRKGKAS